jgi:hypothetical protein
MLNKSVIEEMRNILKANMVVETLIPRGCGMNGTDYRIFFEDRPCTKEKCEFLLEDTYIQIKQRKGKEECNIILVPYEMVCSVSFCEKGQQYYNGYRIVD